MDSTPKLRVIGPPIERPQARGGNSRGGRGPGQRRRGRRSRFLTRGLPLLVVIGAGATVVVVVVLVLSTNNSQRTLVRRYVRDWTARDFTAMYGMLSAGSRADISESAFTAAYTHAADTATATSLHFSRGLRIHGQTATVPMEVQTRTFGRLFESARLQLAADGTSLLYTPSMVFPGLAPGERLTRTSTLGRRGDLLTRDGTLLAAGTSLDTDISPGVAGEIVGTLGPIPAAQRSRYEAEGYPAGAQVGQDGLEQVFQRELAGQPGGVLSAGSRVLARRAAHDGKTVRTTIDPDLESDAISSISNSFLGGIVVLNEKTGGIEAAAGQAFTNVQPPGSTFKIITATAALESGVSKLDTVYPILSQVSLGGYITQNAGGETCGGTFINAFASSCNTTFGPIGITLGAQRLLATARRYGFDEPVAGIPSALESSVPESLTSAGDAALGEAAFGQWEDEATPLEMADAAATVADGGRRPLPTFSATTPTRFVAVTTSKVARQVQQMMVAVNTYEDGTGYPDGQIAGYTVAGKTGTAELATTANQQNDAKETDAWYVGYVVGARDPLVACAIFPEDGYGATAALPAVIDVLEESLGISPG